MSLKDNRFYPLLTLSVLFLVVSFVLLCILGYNFYTQQNPGNIAAVSVPKKTLSPAQEKTRDTLQQLYTNAVNSMPASTTADTGSIKSDSLQTGTFDNSIGDVNKLKTEINTLLKDSTSTTADLELARYKIKELQLRVDELKTRNGDVEKENRRLRALLEQMALNNNSISPVNTSSKERVSTIENINSTSPVFSASDLKLSTANADDAEVVSADETEKFVGSMVVRNSLVQGMGEVMLVLIQPDGKVLRNAWESGSFDTDGGKRIYSRKIKFDYNKGESRRIDFSVPADNIQKGTYTMQVYNNGKLIGRVAKAVS
jgi:FtsZ-binding cell division protein ZapB